MTGHSILLAHITNATWFGRSSALSLSLPRILPCILYPPNSHPYAFEALRAAVYGIDANIIDVEVDFPGISTTFTPWVCLTPLCARAVTACARYQELRL
jgi:hypothetical protein